MFPTLRTAAGGGPPAVGLLAGVRGRRRRRPGAGRRRGRAVVRDPAGRHVAPTRRPPPGSPAAAAGPAGRPGPPPAGGQLPWAAGRTLDRPGPARPRPTVTWTSSPPRTPAGGDVYAVALGHANDGGGPAVRAFARLVRFSAADGTRHDLGSVAVDPPVWPTHVRPGPANRVGRRVRPRVGPGRAGPVRRHRRRPARPASGRVARPAADDAARRPADRRRLLPRRPGLPRRHRDGRRRHCPVRPRGRARRGPSSTPLAPATRRASSRPSVRPARPAGPPPHIRPGQMSTLERGPTRPGGRRCRRTTLPSTGPRSPSWPPTRPANRLLYVAVGTGPRPGRRRAVGVRRRHRSVRDGCCRCACVPAGSTTAGRTRPPFWSGPTRPRTAPSCCRPAAA